MICLSRLRVAKHFLDHIIHTLLLPTTTISNQPAMEEANQDLGRSRDWVYDIHTNCHVCNDRAWFTEYTPLQTMVLTLMTNHPVAVFGIGRVSIPVKRTPNLSGTKNHGLIEVDNVLHAPNYFCNVLGKSLPRRLGFKVDFRGGKNDKGGIKDETGKSVAFFRKSHPLFALEVRGEPTGPKLMATVFEAKNGYRVSCQWSAPQRIMWKKIKKANARKVDDGSPKPRNIFESMDKESEFKETNFDPNAFPPYTIGVANAGEESPPYKELEMEYIDKRYHGEFKFLQQFGLSIDEEDQRELGKKILRGVREFDLDNFTRFGLPSVIQRQF